MARVFGVIAFLVLGAVALVPATPRVEAAQPPKNPPPVKIGVPQNLFSNLPPSVLQPVAKPFQTLFEKQTGLKGEVEIGKDYAEITQKLLKGNLDVAVYHGHEYAWVQHHQNLHRLVIAVPVHKIQVCVVVHANSKAKLAGDLKGDCITIPAGVRPQCRLYLEKLRTGLPDGCCGIAKVEGKTIEEVLDGVADGKTYEAGLVDLATLTAYRANKPGVGKQLRVLAESEVFPCAVIIYRQGAFDAKKVRKGLIASVTTPQGQILTRLWRLKGFEEPGDQYQKDLDRCLKTYPPPKPK